MSKTKVLGLAVLAGALLGAAWFPPFTVLIFVALVPLLLLTPELLNFKKPKGAAFLFSYIAFVIWNAIDTWWTWFASPGGAVMAILANSLLMAFTYLIFFVLYKKLQATKFKPYAIWLLVPAWLSFEYLHTLWELAWTWLTLGNVFAFTHNWVQWYEFTGVSGGSLWILAVNILVFTLVSGKGREAGGEKQGARGKKLQRVLVIVGFVVVPVVFSYLLIPTELKTGKARGQQIVVVQPNIDPYNEKFNSSYESQLVLVYNLVKDKITAETDYLVLPETFFTENMWEDHLEESYSVKFLRDSILRKYPNLVIVTGATTFYQFKAGEKLSATAHKYTDANEHYDVFNTALQLDNFGDIQVYHKSKLVPGAERIPYPAVFKPLEQFAINLGGTVGSLGVQEERGVLFNKDKSVGVAPVICYESVFGEYVTDYFKQGANLIFIITNDGWWKDTPGKIQHLNYARLRAIETRAPIARCANTGISCFIDEKGNFFEETKWWEPAVISASLKPNNERTFYVKCGDVISKIALVVFALAFFGVIVFVRKSSASGANR